MNIYVIAIIVLAFFGLWILYVACSAFVTGYRNSRLKPGEKSIEGLAISTGGKPVDGKIVKGCFQIGGFFLILGLGFASPLILEITKTVILKAHIEKYDFEDEKTASILFQSLGANDLSIFQVYKLSETDHARSVDLFLSALDNEARAKEIEELSDFLLRDDPSAVKRKRELVEKDLAALTALVQLNHPSAVKRVMEILDARQVYRQLPDLDPYADLVAALIKQLGPSGENALFEFLDTRNETGKPYFVGKVLARLDSNRTYEALIGMVTAEMVNGPYYTMLWILGDSKRTEARDLLINLSHPSGQPKFRFNAIGGLAKFQDQVAMNALLELSRTESNPDNLIKISEGLRLYDWATVHPAYLRILKHEEWRVRRSAMVTIGDSGNVDAIGDVVPFLVDWQMSKTVVNSLTKLGWVASSPREKVRLWVAKKDRRLLEANWAMAKEVLLSDLVSRDKLAVENSVFAFIGLGNKKSLELLEEQLERKGNKIMAEVYLNSGNRSLYKYGKKWAHRRGYQIERGDGARYASWGSWK